MFTGKRGNLLTETPEHCRQLKLPHPILANEDLERLRTVKRDDFKVVTISALFDAETSDHGRALGEGLEKRSEDFASEVAAATKS